MSLLLPLQYHLGCSTNNGRHHQHYQRAATPPLSEKNDIRLSSIRVLIYTQIRLILTPVRLVYFSQKLMLSNRNAAESVLRFSDLVHTPSYR